ncbi:hypothetical protein ACIRFH_34660 [Streptomyces sp. NPDC093586]|uniref:hypothetical protein n=1 Tax=Streptomyces sp. NPDC093586 TaxID=3366042 RepID=UPI003823C92B
MTKNGSSARKARIRALADKEGISHRQATRKVDAKRAQEEDAHAAQKARLRSFIHNPEDLAEERTRYLSHMLAADLPDMVRVCLFVLADSLGTGKYTDTQGVSFTVPELADLTGLSPSAVEDSLNLARAHGWMTGDSSDNARLCVPGEDIDMYEMFLKRIKQPVRDSELHHRVLEQIEQELSRQAREAEETRAMFAQFSDTKTAHPAS